MKSLIAKIWVPVLLVLVAAAQSFGIDTARAISQRKQLDSLTLNRLDDTVVTTDFAIDSMKAFIADSLAAADSVLVDSTAADSLSVEETLVLNPRDTIRIPDSLEFTDPFKFKYYIAIKDSTTRFMVRDSLLQAGDTSFFSSFCSTNCKTFFACIRKLIF